LLGWVRDRLPRSRSVCSVNGWRRACVSSVFPRLSKQIERLVVWVFRCPRLEEHDHIDLTIDGADEVDVGTLALLKGRGGALLREKIIASASEQLIIVVDETKLVDRVGVKSPMAIEVVPFGWRATARRLRRLVTSLERRTTSEGAPFMTDGGHHILDCVGGEIEDPEDLQRQLDGTVGVVEHGLFLGLASRVIVGGSHGVRVLQRT
jgi:ribose 5-phosphate isomerase A